MAKLNEWNSTEIYLLSFNESIQEFSQVIQLKQDIFPMYEYVTAVKYIQNFYNFNRNININYALLCNAAIYIQKQIVYF